MPSQLKNLVFNLTAPHKIDLITVDLPEDISADYVRVSIEYCGICGTDLCYYHGYRNEGYPICLGHEHCGTIIRTGTAVKTLKKGDFVAIDPNYRCGQCRFCKNKQSHLCEEFNVQLYSNKGYAKYVDIHQSYLHLLPQFTSRFVGALVEPLSVALNAIDISNIQNDKNSNVFILGIGNIGSLLSFGFLSLFKDMNITIYDKNPSKIKTIQAIYPNRIRTINSISEGSCKYSYVFEATGHASGFEDASMLLEKKGTLVVISRYYQEDPKISNNLITWKDPTIRIAHLNGNGESMTQASSLLLSHWTEKHNELLAFYNFNEIERAFAEYESNNKNKKIIDMSYRNYQDV